MLEFHPVTEIFPLMQGEQYDQLVKDIGENGLREAIWLHPDERIIDGRNRYRACLDAGVEPRFQIWDGEGSLIQFVVSLNLHRRHLTSSQRAAAAAEALEQLKIEAKERQREGGKTKVRQKIAEAPDAGKATEQAARMFGTNRTYVAEAANLKEEDPEKFEEVKRGVVRMKPISDARRRRERNRKEFERLCKGKKELVARMEEASLKENDQLKLARWSDLWFHDGHDKTRWANRALDLYAEEVPLDEAMDQADQESAVERHQKHKEEHDEQEKRFAEEEDRGFREHEPFEHFAEFLFRVEPVDGLTVYTTHYEVIIRHLKNCKLTKLVTALEKKKAERDAEMEEDDKRANGALAEMDGERAEDEQISA